jgi:hypothetical protein
VEKRGMKMYVTERNGKISSEQQGIVAFCTCQWNRIEEGCHPLAVVIMHIHKCEIKDLRNLSPEGYI